ncbi:MAG: hypothetical protein ABIJ84_02660 [bacterium]
MKLLFLINNASFFPNFFGKLAYETVKRGDNCLVVFNSKIAEYNKKKFFPEEAKFISKVDWCIKNYNKDKKDFNDLSWKEFFPIFDRFQGIDFNYNNSFKIVSQTCQFFEFIFEKEKPDVVISEVPAGLFHNTAYHFCEKKNILYLDFTVSRISGMIEVLDKKFTFLKYEENFKKINSSDLSESNKHFAREIVDQFTSHKKVPTYMNLPKIYLSQIDIIRHFVKRIKEYGKLLLKYFKERKRFKDFDYESEAILNNAIKSPWKIERRKFKILFQRHIFDKFDKDKNEDFFFYPLHFQPESSTSVYATYYSDQLNTIKNVAFSMPFPYKLYVKEHPVAVGTRPKSFYKKLKEIPNVVLIAPYENVENIVKNSLGVIILTSTIGLEAALAGKPVYVLGDVFYSYHPLCKSIKNFEELKEKIEKDLAKRPDTNDLENINSRFIISYFKNTIEGSILSASIGEDKNDYELIYKNIKKIILDRN